MNPSFASLEKPAEPDHRVRYRQPAGDHPTAVARSVHDQPMSPQAAGNLATQRLLRSRVIQPKLTVNTPGDAVEQEADRVADQVMSSASDPSIQRKCDACAAGGTCPECEEEERLQPKESPGHAPGITTKVESSLASLRGGGQPLAPSVRAFFEPRFGRDFSGVRVHTDTAGAQSAKEIHARAYTVGSDVVFADGQFSPSNSDGRTLLAHELTHVVQQGGGAVAIQRAPDPDMRWKRDVNAARYRGRLIAERIRKHTKLSKEARAKINSELAYFEDEAKEAYIREVKPALLAVVEIEMPEERRAVPPPKPIGLSLLSEETLCGGQKCFTDEDIYAPLTEAEKKEESERAEAREGELDKLRQRTKDWGDDQAFALEQLGRVIRDRTNVDPRAVSDAIRQPILDRYERWLRTVDTMRLAKCPELGVLEKTRARASGDDPCKSWFADEYSHGPSELLDLERQLRIHRGSASSAVEQVYWDVFDYRKKTDPKMLEQYQIAAALVNLGVAVAVGVGAKVNAPPSIPVGGFRVSGLKAGYKIQICNDSTVIETPTGLYRPGIHAQGQGGAVTDPVTKTIWIHESVVQANGMVRSTLGNRLNLKQVVAHEMGHAQMEGGGFAMASRIGADLPWLTAEERIGLLDDAVYLARETGVSLDDLRLPQGYRPPPPTPKAP